MTTSLRHRALLAIVVAAAGVFLLRAGGAIAGPEWDARLLIFGGLTKLALQALAFACALGCVARFERGNPARSPWMLMAAGLGAYAAGQSVLTYYQAWLRVQSPFPSIADAFFLAAYPAMIAALIGFIRAYDEVGVPMGTHGERRAWTIGIALAVVVVSLPVLWPLAMAPTPALEKAVGLAYPVLDAILMVPAVLLLREALKFLGGSVGAVWLGLVGGILCIGAGDVLFAYFSSLGLQHLEALVDALYVLGYGGLALGSLAQLDLLAD